MAVVVVVVIAVVVVVAVFVFAVVEDSILVEVVGGMPVVKVDVVVCICWVVSVEVEIGGAVGLVFFPGLPTRITTVTTIATRRIINKIQNSFFLSFISAPCSPAIYYKYSFLTKQYINNQSLSIAYHSRTRELTTE